MLSLYLRKIIFTVSKYYFTYFFCFNHWLLTLQFFQYSDYIKNICMFYISRFFSVYCLIELARLSPFFLICCFSICKLALLNQFWYKRTFLVAKHSRFEQDSFAIKNIRTKSIRTREQSPKGDPGEVNGGEGGRRLARPPK